MNYERINDVSTSVRSNSTAANRVVVPTVQGNHVPAYPPCPHPAISSLPYHQIMKSEIMKLKHEMPGEFIVLECDPKCSRKRLVVGLRLNRWKCSQRSPRLRSRIKKEIKLWSPTESAVPTK